MPEDPDTFRVSVSPSAERDKELATLMSTLRKDAGERCPPPKRPPGQYSPAPAPPPPPPPPSTRLRLRSAIGGGQRAEPSGRRHLIPSRRGERETSTWRAGPPDPQRISGQGVGGSGDHRQPRAAEPALRLSETLALLPQPQEPP
ncbi:Small Subunit Processome Component 20-like [Manis pentadactyla]|nr:Small Subunit Processome Component 20-like [Manis pentadactyla]